MALLKKGSVEAGATPRSIHLIAGEPESTAAALTAAAPGDLVVVTPTDVFASWKQVCEFEKVRSATSQHAHVIAAE